MKRIISEKTGVQLKKYLISLSIILLLIYCAGCRRKAPTPPDPRLENIASWKDVGEFKLLKPPTLCPTPQNYLRCFDLRMNHNFADVFRGGARIEVEWKPTSADVWILSASSPEGAEIFWDINSSKLMADALAVDGLGERARIWGEDPQRPDVELHVLTGNYWVRVRTANTGKDVRVKIMSLARNVISRLTGQKEMTPVLPKAPDNSSGILGRLFLQPRLKTGKLANMLLCLGENDFYNAIDGKSDYYFEHGVFQALFGDAMIGRPNPAFVQIFRASKASDARFLLDDTYLEKPVEVKEVKGAALARIDQGLPFNVMLVAQVGSYFLQIVIAEKNPEAEAAVENLGRELISLLASEK